MPGFLVPDEPITSLDDYLAAGGGQGLTTALMLGPEATIDRVRASGLRGRGGAGFPTGYKWAGLADDESTIKYVVANGAEGEPGTFKDRWLMRRNPYQLLEGLQIAAFAVGAAGAFVGLKRRFTEEALAVKRALAEMSDAGLTGDLPVGVMEGPDDYLFGEEKALLEVIDGNAPLPRLYPPYIEGIGATPGNPNPAVVNNVETLSNVPHILRHGPEWFRSMGTEDSPGTMVFTISGDVRIEAVVEMELGTPLSFLIFGIGGGLAAGRRVKAALSGVSNRPLPAAAIDAPLSFEGMQAAGSGLGSGGFVAYDDSRCMAAVGEALSRFLNAESCGQCPPCKVGTGEIVRRLARLQTPDADAGELEEMAAWVMRVTDANRCGLGAGQQALAGGLLEHFFDDLARHVGGDPCPLDHDVVVPKLASYHPDEGSFSYQS